MRRRAAALLLLAAGARAQPAETAAEEEQAQKALADYLADTMAILSHGSDHSKQQAAEGIYAMAVETTEGGPFHPLTFRNAAVQAGIIEQLVRLLEESSTRDAQKAALAALEAIATDDPTTESDNGHAGMVCAAGAVPHIIRLLGSAEEDVQVHAAGCAGVLAESPPCQTMLTEMGAEELLAGLATYGNDVAKLHAVAALDLLGLNNPASHGRLAQAGGKALLDGLQRYGGQAMRSVTGGLAAGLSADGGATRSVSVDAKAHAKQAHETRLKHSRLFTQATGVRRAYAPADVE